MLRLLLLLAVGLALQVPVQAQSGPQSLFGTPDVSPAAALRAGSPAATRLDALRRAPAYEAHTLLSVDTRLDQAPELVFLVDRASGQIVADAAGHASGAADAARVVVTKT